ncbi:LysR family transcriptional regulator [Propionicimonas sp.]|uniref:LysR family transcriptional regulator n=1 Tax=Propionicimonas sp. TaxID=1955623 RepID=UPI001852236D|nr:LysR family transcriptional regulator [Propionicimonas sp.]MBU3977957.1 LysR family transcriptional regulator [Actinomycetota bacterium]MBA3021820.1 LysR family transcriptional regulator [Propionicimonas sp.]MBU3985401.1 LysR family transcriptional regulator [Actinomycetota bacterium]MBU4007496.1 LysR family transcriptional regulator [Actinomycetota bacterium]MBU4066610.1 LysR family transcriptional regulator [Actinomycetota bacterium]
MNSALDLHTVRIVRAIADYGSITAAAAALGYSQPALSQHLRRAEKRLGVPLLLRTGRGVQLTEPGRVVARHSAAVLAALAAAEDELGHLADRTTGTVRLAGFPSASSVVVPALMATLAAQHPGLKLIYTEAEPPESLELLAEGSIDIALTFTYPGDPSDPHDDLVGVELQELFADPAVLVLPAGHRLAHGTQIDLGAFEAERWIAGCPLCRGHLLAACSAKGFSPRIAHATDNSVAVLGLVAAGVGIALQPKLALEPLEAPAGTVVLDVPGNDRRVRAAYLRGSSAVPAIGATLEALQAVTAGRR